VPKPHDFSLKLTRVIEPKGQPGVELATLEDAARFMGKMRPFRLAWPHLDYAAELMLIAAATAKRRTSKERRRRWNERYGVTIGCDDAARFLLAWRDCGQTEDGTPRVRQVQQTGAIPD
jgi:hypothetical protein